MMTDFDYFENEIKKCRERIAKAGSGDIKEKQKLNFIVGRVDHFYFSYCDWLSW